MNKFEKAFATKGTVKQIHAIHASVKLDEGMDQFSFHRVLSFDGKTPNWNHSKGFYELVATGGTDGFGKPAKLGVIHSVLHSHVIAV